MPAEACKVFVSYTHENDAHRSWVARLAADLRINGVNALLDQWECEPGSDLNRYMEHGIREADRVILVCTPRYADRVQNAEGGVGFETLVVNAELASDLDISKFICVLRAGEAQDAIPLYAQTRLYIDLRETEDYQAGFKPATFDSSCSSKNETAYWSESVHW